MSQLTLFPEPGGADTQPGRKKSRREVFATMDNSKLLSHYLLSLPATQRPFSGKRVAVICRFLESGTGLNKKACREYISQNKCVLSTAQKELLLDFLYFYGISFGKVRKQTGKIVKPLEVLSEANKLKVSGFISWCEKQYDYSPSSIKIKSQNMKKFFRYFTEFNVDNCRSFISTQEAEGRSPKTLNVYMLTLKQYGDYIKKPVKLKKISVPTTLSVENVPTLTEYNNFIEWLKANGEMRFYWIVRALGQTGMRRSELEQIRFSDILQGEASPKCKGKKIRIIYFPKSLTREVREYLKTAGIEPDKKLIDCSRCGGEYSSRGLDQRLKSLAAKAGFPKEKAHCHAFRHFFAKQYLTRCKDVVQLSELLGHESVNTTRLYLLRSKEEQRREINRHINW